MNKINIKILNKYKSITPPCEFELPFFSVFTGKNGSGKTHLLEAISKNEISQVLVNRKQLTNIKYIKFNGLNPNINETCNPSEISNFVKPIWQNYLNFVNRYKNTNRLNKETIIRNFSNKQQSFVKKVLTTNKLLTEITEEDFFDAFSPSDLENSDFFTAQFALIFKNYYNNLEKNRYNEYCTSNGRGEARSFLTEEEFINKYGEPPWIFVNKILEKTNIPYEVNNPEGERTDTNFQFYLKDKQQGFKISSQDLSTGEKVLMSLALAIYNTTEAIGKPELLLIDEPDAALHPSMSKIMMKILQENVIEQNEIPVIISTHSPTTVVVTEGISLFQINREASIPKKINIQQGIEILTSDIPYLKISTEKRRQVFVESKYDVNYYELLRNIFIRKGVKFPSEPHFIPAKINSSSNCAEVKSIVKSLSNSGNDQIYGIIDWDLKNKSEGKIIVNGENDRYSMENYLLDPLLIGLLLIREHFCPISAFGISNISSYIELKKLTKAEAQKIIDKILYELNLNSENKKSYNTFNDWELFTTDEFNRHQGHDLEILYKNKYPSLNKYQREDSLKKEIINIIIDEYPQYAPKIFCITFNKII